MEVDDIVKGVHNPSKIPRYVRNLWRRKVRRMKISSRMWYYRLTSKNYTSAYQKLMRYRIREQGPRRAVGGDTHGIGELQFSFLCERGLEPNHSLLDIGCGSLRGGQYFIEYLDAANYVGMDISADAIAAGKNLVNDDLLNTKQPTFYVNNDLRFNEIEGKVDYALAQSVFTHLPRDDIMECLTNIKRVLTDSGALYATFFTHHEGVEAKNFAYSTPEMEEMAEAVNLQTKLYPESAYPHPRGQRIMRFQVA